jgi:DNA-binding protein H-NS
MNLKSMSIDKLTKLRDQVDTILRSKVADERRTLEAELGRLSRLSTSESRSKGFGFGARGPVAPKYRNPQNPSETWAGRGLTPRWLAAALKAGKKLEHFSIAQTTKQAMEEGGQEGPQNQKAMTGSGRADVVVVDDRMQTGYSYLLTEPMGRNFDPEFRPELTPKQMLALGVFCGNDMTDCQKEFPAGWFAHARLSRQGRYCSSTISVPTPVSRFRCDAERAGYIPMIRTAGSSGIAAITWAAACRMRTRARSSAGRPSAVTRHNCGDTASPAM